MEIKSVAKFIKSVSKWNRRRLDRRHNQKVLLEPVNIPNDGKFVVLTTRHCLHVAYLIKDALERIGRTVSVITDEPANGFSKSFHFVICPQMFPKLPGQYVAFQMEQSVHHRWFTPQYFDILKKATAVLDYSVRNISFLEENGFSYNKIYYVPIDVRNRKSFGVCCDEKKYDVLFYGDASNERRKRFLGELSKEFDVKVVTNLFGEELHRELLSAKVVVNVHYYENALLETTRIYECLSLGVSVVSEESSNMGEYPHLLGRIHFTPIDNVVAMTAKVRQVLNGEVSTEYGINSANSVVGGNLFDYYFYRFLLAHDLMSFAEFVDQTEHQINLNFDVLCLGLPESIKRKESFDRDNSMGFGYFPGIRHGLGWVGCGLSYKYLANISKKRGLSTLAICEDDVFLKSGWMERFKNVRSYLNHRAQGWDLFCGLLTDFHAETSIRRIDCFLNENFIEVDKMTGMVFNIYGVRAFDKLMQWDENDRIVQSNTIDRYIESCGDLSIVTVFPFLVGHKDDLNSTLWGNAQNSHYNEMISRSERDLMSEMEKMKSEI